MQERGEGVQFPLAIEDCRSIIRVGELVPEVGAVHLRADFRLCLEGRLEGVAVGLDFDVARVEVDHSPEEGGQGIGGIGRLQQGEIGENLVGRVAEPYGITASE